jgi:hypothetical protein
MEGAAHRREEERHHAHSRVRALVAVVACAIVAAVALGSAAAWRRGGRTALTGAADFNSISGKATIFWGEEDGAPGRYPPEYAAQLKKMRRLVKRVKMNNDRSLKSASALPCAWSRQPWAAAARHVRHGRAPVLTVCTGGAVRAGQR